MTEADLIRLRSILTELAPQGRAALLPALHLAQQFHGWLPEAVAAEVGRALGVPLADVYGVIDFYADALPPADGPNRRARLQRAGLRPRRSR